MKIYPNPVLRCTIYIRELLQEIRNDSRAKYGDLELNRLEECPQKDQEEREQLNNQRTEAENFPEGDYNLIDREEISQKRCVYEFFFAGS